MSNKKVFDLLDINKKESSKDLEKEIDRNKKQIKKNDFIYFLNCFFKDDLGYSKLKNSLKEKYFYLIIFILAKKYPDVINVLQLNTINKVGVLDVWHNKIIKDFKGYTPKWAYGKIKNFNSNKSLFDEIEDGEDGLKLFCKFNFYTKKDFLQAYDFFGKDFIDAVNENIKILKRNLSD